MAQRPGHDRPMGTALVSSGAECHHHPNSSLRTWSIRSAIFRCPARDERPRVLSWAAIEAVSSSAQSNEPPSLNEPAFSRTAKAPMQPVV